MGYGSAHRILKRRNENSQVMFLKVFNILRVRKIQIKNALRFHLTPVRMAKIKNATNKHWPRQEREALIHC